MNEKDKELFERDVRTAMRNMGSDLRYLQVGLDYYRGLESKLVEVTRERDELAASLTKLRGEFAYFKASKASTVEISAVGGDDRGGTGKCRKSGICSSWEPEPQTPGEMSGKRGAALERDEDKHDTERLPTAEEKKSFFQKLFGG